MSAATHVQLTLFVSHRREIRAVDVGGVIFGSIDRTIVTAVQKSAVDAVAVAGLHIAMGDPRRERDFLARISSRIYWIE